MQPLWVICVFSKYPAKKKQTRTNFSRRCGLSGFKISEEKKIVQAHLSVFPTDLLTIINFYASLVVHYTHTYCFLLYKDICNGSLCLGHVSPLSMQVLRARNRKGKINQNRLTLTMIVETHTALSITCRHKNTNVVKK